MIFFYIFDIFENIFSNPVLERAPQDHYKLIYKHWRMSAKAGDNVFIVIQSI